MSVHTVIQIAGRNAPQSWGRAPQTLKPVANNTTVRKTRAFVPNFGTRPRTKTHDTGKMGVFWGGFRKKSPCGAERAPILGQSAPNTQFFSKNLEPFKNGTFHLCVSVGYKRRNGLYTLYPKTPLNGSQCSTEKERVELKVLPKRAIPTRVLRTVF